MIKIKEIATYHPQHQVGNDMYVDSTDERRRHFIEDVLGKKNRYVKAEKENGFNMMKRVAVRVLEKANLTGQDIDMVVVATQTPEFMLPPMSAAIGNHIGIKEKCCFYDVNTACAGMTFAIYQAYGMMMWDRKISKTLIVCCDLNQHFIDKNDTLYGVFGDLSSAVILEKDDEPMGSRIIDSLIMSDTDCIDAFRYPVNKMSNINNNDEIKLVFNQEAPSDKTPTRCVEGIEVILGDNNLTIDNIKLICSSQFNATYSSLIKEHFNIGDDKAIYTGDKYGYTAGSSPIKILHDAVKEGKVQRGDKVIIWTVGAGSQIIILLLQY